MPPGKEGKITLAVQHTEGYSGEITKFATVNSNDPANPSLRLSLHVFFKAKPAPAGTPAPTVYAPVTRVGPFDISPSNRWVTAIIRGSSLPTTLTLKDHDPNPVHITGVEPGGSGFAVTLRTISDGKDYSLYIVTNPELKPGHYQQTAELVTDSKDFPKIPISLDLTVYPDVIVTPAQIRIQPGPSSDYSKVMVPIIYVRKVRGTGLQIKKVSSSLPFLNIQVTPELPGQNYKLLTTVDNSKVKGAGKYDGTIKIETDDKEAPELTVNVHVEFS